MQKWLKEDPAIGEHYQLFCDLVHPNLGSSLMLGQIHESFASIGFDTGQPFGLIVFEHTFPDLLRMIKMTFLMLEELEALRFD